MNISTESTAGNCSVKTTIPFCIETYRACLIETLSTICFVLDGTGVLLNIGHIWILQKLKSEQGNLHLRLLQYASGSDLFAAVSNRLRGHCRLRIFLRDRPIVVSTVIVFWDWVYLFRYYVLAFSSYERYLAICKPFSYSQNRFVNNSRLALALAAGICLLTTGLREYAFRNHLCLDSYLGYSSSYHNTEGSLYSAATVVILMTIIIICSAKVLLELKRIKDRNTMQENDDIKRITKYILVNNLLFIACLIPVTLTFIVLSVANSHSVTALFISTVPYTSYGAVNVIVFALMTKGYKAHIRQIIGCKRGTVDPGL